MANLIVVYDACVLYPAPLRDFLLHLALTQLFRARWSADIHAEWIRNLLKNRPDLTRARLERTRELMDSSVPDCLVTGYEGLIANLDLPDPDDRHVLAAAIGCQAGIIVTFNLDDFPATLLARYAIEVQHPDEFVQHLLELDTAAVCLAARQHRQHLKNPPKSPREYLHTLLAQRLTGTVAQLEEMLELL